VMTRFGVVRSAQLASTATMVIGPSAQRVALMFSPPTIPGTSYTVSNDPAVVLGGGINLAAGSSPVEVSTTPYGDTVQKPWYGIASAGMSTIGFLETIDVSLPRQRRSSKRKGK
jgi:hypothetical protein